MKKQTIEQLQRKLKMSHTPNFNQNRMEETILQSKKILQMSQLSERITFCEFFKSQFGFIRKKVWAIQLLILLMCCLTAHRLSSSMESLQVLALVSSLVPLIVLISIPEVSRSFTRNMMEIELCTKYSLNKLMMVRLSIFGLLGMLSVTLLVGFLDVQFEMDFFNIILYLFVPFNLTCFGCLWILNHIRTKDSDYYCLAYGIFLMFAVFVLAFRYIKLYEASASGIWLTILIVSLAAIATELHKMLLNCKTMEPCSLS